jgi:hypothetical protein
MMEGPRTLLDKLFWLGWDVWIVLLTLGFIVFYG